MKRSTNSHWFSSFTRHFPLGGRSDQKPLLTRFYTLSTLGLVTAFGLSSALASQGDNTSNQQSSSNAAKTQVELRKDQRATTMDINSRHGAGGTDIQSDQRSEAVTNDASTTVTVNGESVPVPENGTTNRTIKGEDGNTHVDVTVQNSTTGTDDSDDGRRTQRTRLKVDTNSSTNTRSSTNMIENSE